MEEDTVELADYLRIIWKRKVLIIVGTLVCAAAVCVATLRVQKKHSVEVNIKIGKRIGIESSSFVDTDTPANLTKSIPLEYGLEKEAIVSGYCLTVQIVSGSTLLRLVVQGPDKSRAKEYLESIVTRFIGDIQRVEGQPVRRYEDAIVALESEAKIIAGNIEQAEKMRREIINAGKDYSAVMMMDRNELFKRLVEVKRDILKTQLIVDSTLGNRTRVIGRVRDSQQKLLNKKLYVLLGVVVGLAISIFLAFFIEFLGNVREKEKRKSMS